jgi:drug/metabolite transporter (DMT)-like permease
MKRTDAADGYLFVAGAALLWASSGIAGKYLFLSGIKPQELVQFRVTLASGLLFLVLALFRRSLLKIRKSDAFSFLILGGGVMAVLQLSYFLAVAHIQVAAAIVLQYLAPILVAMYSMAFWKERCTPAKIAALALSFTGCYLVAGGYSLSFTGMNSPGLFWGLCSAFFFAAYTLLVERQVRRYSPWTVLFYSLFLAGVSINLAYGPLAIAGQGRSAEQWLLIVYVAVFGTLLPYGLFSIGVSRIRSTRAIITATLEPISAAVMAFFLISELLSGMQMMGGAFVIAAVVILQLEREHDRLSPEVIRARGRSPESGDRSTQNP